MWPWTRGLDFTDLGFCILKMGLKIKVLHRLFLGTRGVRVAKGPAHTESSVPVEQLTELARTQGYMRQG